MTCFDVALDISSALYDLSSLSPFFERHFMTCPHRHLMTSAQHHFTTCPKSII